MRLRRLCKDGNSTDEDECPAIYLAEDPAVMVAQGKLLDAPTMADLQNLAPDEIAAALPTETVLRAAALFLAEQGRPAMGTEVEDFLMAWEPHG